MPSKALKEKSSIVAWDKVPKTAGRVPVSLQKPSRRLIYIAVQLDNLTTWQFGSPASSAKQVSVACLNTLPRCIESIFFICSALPVAGDMKSEQAPHPPPLHRQRALQGIARQAEVEEQSLHSPGGGKCACKSQRGTEAP